jgi:hypothetical protein
MFKVSVIPWPSTFLLYLFRNLSLNIRFTPLLDISFYGDRLPCAGPIVWTSESLTCRPGKQYGLEGARFRLLFELDGIAVLIFSCEQFAFAEFVLTFLPVA